MKSGKKRGRNQRQVIRRISLHLNFKIIKISAFQFLNFIMPILFYRCLLHLHIGMVCFHIISLPSTFQISLIVSFYLTKEFVDKWIIFGFVVIDLPAPPRLTFICEVSMAPRIHTDKLLSFGVGVW